MKARLGLAVALAAVGLAAVAQTAPEQPVKRPDGSIVYPDKNAQDATLTPAAREAAARAEEREKMRQDQQQALEERIERSRREREAALSSPARKIPSTTLPR